MKCTNCGNKLIELKKANYRTEGITRYCVGDRSDGSLYYKVLKCEFFTGKPIPGEEDRGKRIRIVPHTGICTSCGLQFRWFSREQIKEILDLEAREDIM